MNRRLTDMQRIERDREGFRAARADDNGVTALAAAMKIKLAIKRAEGYGGWSRPEDCTVEHLAGLLIDHLSKGDPVDVANFCMMLFNREGGAAALAKVYMSRATAERQPEPREDAPNDWEPIATAPRDGTLVLTYSPRAVEQGFNPVRVNFFRKNAWQHSNETFWPPTHWQPLPPPPKLGADDDGGSSRADSAACIASDGTDPQNQHSTGKED